MFRRSHIVLRVYPIIYIYIKLYPVYFQYIYYYIYIYVVLPIKFKRLLKIYVLYNIYIYIIPNLFPEKVAFMCGGACLSQIVDSNFWCNEKIYSQKYIIYINIYYIYYILYILYI